MASATFLERLVLVRLSAVESAGTTTTRTISSNLLTIKQLITTGAPDSGPIILAKFIQSVHMLASYKQIFAKVLTPCKVSPQFDLIWNDSALRCEHNALAGQCIALEDALGEAFRHVVRAGIVGREHRLRMELAMLEHGMKRDAAYGRFYGVWRRLELLRLR
jgi:hypothetical protein